MSLACSSMPVSFVMGLVAVNVSPSWPTWPVKRTLRLGAQGGETTDGWFLGVILTFVTIGGLVAAFYALFCLCFSAASFSFLENSSRNHLFFFLLFHGFFRMYWHGAKCVTASLQDECEVTRPVTFLDIDKKHPSDDVEDTKVSKKDGVFGSI